jgi:ferredoxin
VASSLGVFTHSIQDAFDDIMGDWSFKCIMLLADDSHTVMNCESIFAPIRIEADRESDEDGGETCLRPENVPMSFESQVTLKASHLPPCLLLAKMEPWGFVAWVAFRYMHGCRCWATTHQAWLLIVVAIVGDVQILKQSVRLAIYTLVEHDVLLLNYRCLGGGRCGKCDIILFSSVVQAGWRHRPPSRVYTRTEVDGVKYNNEYAMKLVIELIKSGELCIG